MSHIDQLRHLLAVIEPASLAMADRLAVLDFARRMFAADTRNSDNCRSVVDRAAP